MWFIIRAAFCVGIVFSMTPGAEKAGDAVNLPALATSLTSEATQGVVDAALQTCKNDPKFCFEMAQRLAAFDGAAPAPPARASSLGATRLVGDTLTAADRVAAPRRGNVKEQRPSARLHPAPRPTG